MEPKLLTRDQFREGVKARDGHRCVFCKKLAEETPENELFAHHILERRLWTDEGYYLENGATVCEEHHLGCERTTISVEDVRHACGITKIVVPEHLYDDHIYDKWGNPVLEDGRRGRGSCSTTSAFRRFLVRVASYHSSRPTSNIRVQTIYLGPQVFMTTIGYLRHLTDLWDAAFLRQRRRTAKTPPCTVITFTLGASTRVEERIVLG